ncbi:hypothetical protein QBC36DRAFT_23522 [Triangularia setosa]|uniref:Uncharacterized protein n=1 Tax=Triangularia setosa TaxID=2587417 RepID=A0AAN6WEI7_9PEZI|nr:hypothetical protein QBC36DRAFT_23522 [Podospora setosa]
MPAVGRDAAKIRVGSKHKRLDEGSTVSGWNTIRTASEVRTDTSRLARRPFQHIHDSSSRLRQRVECPSYVPSSSSHVDRNEGPWRREQTIDSVPDSTDQSSSSTPLVRHVSRQRTESLAQSHYRDSQDTNSAIAHVGRTIPNIPFSQKHLSSKWSSWFRRGGISNMETGAESQCPSEVQISPRVSQRCQQEPKSSWAGLSEDLPHTPYPAESIDTGFDHPMGHPAIRISKDTSETLDRYKQLLATVQGDEQHAIRSHPAVATGGSTANSGRNTISSLVEESTSGNDLDSRSTSRVNDDGFAVNSSPNFMNRFGNGSTSSSGFSSLGAGQIDDLTHGNNESPELSGFYGDSEDTITRSQLQNGELISSSSIANSHGNLWLNHSPSLESFPGVAKHQNMMQTLEADEEWRSFVFGDDNTDEVESTVYAQTSQDTARALQPSGCSCLSCTKEQPKMGHISTGSTGCPLYTADIRQPSDSVEPWSSSDVPSLGVIASSSIDESDAGIIVRHMNENSQGTRHSHTGDDHRTSITCEPGISEESASEAFASQGLRRSSDDEPTKQNSISTRYVGQESPRGEPSRAHAPGSAQYVGSDSPGPLPVSADLSSAASALVPPRPVGVNQSGVQGVEEQARFAPPKLFVGSRSKTQERSNVPVVLRTEPKRRGRPKKRAIDGRADIRGIPNYTSDPIEDFEDHQPTHRSIFPALELA